MGIRARHVGWAALLGAAMGCSSGGDVEPAGPPAALCGGSGSTGSATIDACISQHCCGQLDACQPEAACAACLAGAGTDCPSNALHAAFLQCITQHDCLGEGAGPDGGPCSPDACLAAIAMYPADCAEATCENGQCVYRAKDADGDGQRNKFCKDTSGSAQIEVGTDCDDESPIRFSGAWDGPGGEGQEDRCDGIDQSCSGSADDDVLSSGTSCACTPGAIAQCAATPGGKPIAWPAGEPVGECAYGARECEEDAATGGGRWGPCIGAIEPGLEECNGKDDDCDGETDEDSADPIEWECDEDNDGHLATSAATQESCAEPAAGCAGTWRPGGPHDDCDDEEPLAYTGAPELCDDVDNDCDGTVDNDPVNPTTWYLDADSDGHGDASTQSKVQCERPTSKWKTFDELNGSVNDDCDDANAAINPQAWDGPEKWRWTYGVKPPGWHAKIYELHPPSSCSFACVGQLATTALASGTPLLERDDLVLEFDWNKGAVDAQLGSLTDYFAVRWTAQLQITTPGAYTFKAQANNALRMRIKPGSSGSFTTIIDNWSGTSSDWVDSAPQNLQVGTYDIEVDHFETMDWAFAFVYWEGPDFGNTALRTMHDPVGGSAADSCNQVDNDCSGQPDDAVARDTALPALTYGCMDSPEECDPWAWGPAFLTETCMDPDPTPPDGAPCHSGVRTCLASGRWSSCAGWVHAQPFDVCDNGIDDNCNGVVDTDAPNTFDWYYDGDKDGFRCSGYGCPSPKKQCGDPGDNWVQWQQGDDVDCDDGLKSVYPGASELCDGVDNDCNSGSPADGAVCEFAHSIDSTQSTYVSQHLGSGDYDFAGNGPRVLNRIHFTVDGAGNLVEHHQVEMQETQSDYTRGASSISATHQRQTTQKYCSVISPEWGDGFGGMTKLYLDTNGAGWDTGQESIGDWQFTYSCKGDTSGVDICSGSDCSYYSTHVSGSVKVRLCPGTPY